MSYVTYSGDKAYRRRRPTVSITLSEPMLGYVDELAKKSGRTRSDVVELALRLVAERKELESRILGVKAVAEDIGEEKEKDEDLSRRFMRRLLFDTKNDHEWLQVM